MSGRPSSVPHHQAAAAAAAASVKQIVLLVPVECLGVPPRVAPV